MSAVSRMGVLLRLCLQQQQQSGLSEEGKLVAEEDKGGLHSSGPCQGPHALPHRLPGLPPVFANCTCILKDQDQIRARWGGLARLIEALMGGRLASCNNKARLANLLRNW